MDNNDESKNIILLSQMFTGEYLSDETHIAHEIINLFKADDKKNYLYIPPSGKVGEAEKKKTSAVFFVRNYSRKKVVEIIAVAIGVKPFEGSKEEGKGEDKITFGGKTLSDIYNSEDTEDLITLSFDESTESGVYVPNKTRMIIAMNSEDGFSESQTPADSDITWVTPKQQTLINQSQRTYIRKADDGDGVDAYDKLSNLIDKIKKDDGKTWRKLEQTLPPPTSETQPEKQQQPILRIIKKEADELVFSNLLKHYFDKNRRLLIECIESALQGRNKKMNHRLSDDFDIEREKSFIVEQKQGDGKKRKTRKYIDLWVEDENNIIVIENKIKSGINGIRKNGLISQLDDYYDYAEEEADKNGKDTYFFIFVPDYNKLRLNSENEERYTQVPYSVLHDLFERIASDNENDALFCSFLAGLKRHTKTMSEYNYEIMLTRFVDRVSDIEHNSNK